MENSHENSPLPSSPDQPPVTPIHQKESFWAMLIHFSVLTGYMSFVGFFLAPVLIWILKKEEFPGLDAHFKEAINFQISMLLYLVAIGLITIMTFGAGIIIAIPVGLIIGIIDIIFPIIAGIKANEGTCYRYQLSLRFIR